MEAKIAVEAKRAIAMVGGRVVVVVVVGVGAIIAACVWWAVGCGLWQVARSRSSTSCGAVAVATGNRQQARRGRWQVAGGR